jgi:ABC-2 type transport system ATP-binding protein
VTVEKISAKGYNSDYESRSENLKLSNIMDKDLAIKVENARPAEYAIRVSGVSKTFRIPHEKISSLRGAFVNLFHANGYEEFKALDDVSFEVKKGEFFGIIGRNGSGKSTLLKIIAGIYQPDKGKVKVNGLISPFLELGIGFNPELSGRDNVYLNAAVLGLSHKQIDEKFDDIVEFSELRRFIDQKVKNYSSGMQVRLMFSVAIHANRGILLMDEVLAVGDTNFQKKCIEEFEKYRKEGKTVVLVTHDIETVREYCDKAMLLENGKIIKIGKSSDVVNEYINKNLEQSGRKVKSLFPVNEEPITKDRKKEPQEIKSEKEIRTKEKSREAKDERVQRYGSHRAIIEKIEILNDKKEKSQNLESGKKFSVNLFIRYLDDIENSVFAIVFKNYAGKSVFGIHSLYSRNPVKIRKIAKGEKIKVMLEGEMLLTQGAYDLNVACADVKTHLKFEMLDNREDVARVQVYSEKTLWSYINSDSRVSIEEIF